MGRIIPKKVKKAPLGDFKKKKIKVGKVVKKENATKISVKSKVIYVPNQGTDTGNENFQLILEKQIQLLRHHTAKARQSVVEKINDMVLKNQVAEAYAPMLIIAVIEVLHDDDGSVRSAVLMLFASLCSRFPINVFVACSSNISTYICSGLTIISKTICRDTLKLLKIFCETKNIYTNKTSMEILTPYECKILPLLQQQLEDAIVGYKFTSGNGAQNMNQMKALSKLKAAGSTSYAIKFTAPNASNNSHHYNAEASKKNTKVNMFSLLLDVIGGIIGKEETYEPMSEMIGVAVTDNDIEQIDYTNDLNILLLRSLGCRSADALDECNNQRILCYKLCDTLITVWEALSCDADDGGTLTNDNMMSMQSVAEVFLAIAKSRKYCGYSESSTSSDNVFGLLVSFIKRVMNIPNNNGADIGSVEAHDSQFPYMSEVVNVALTNTSESSIAIKILDKLNITICEIVAAVSITLLNSENFKEYSSGTSDCAQSELSYNVKCIRFAVCLAQVYEKGLLEYYGSTVNAFLVNPEKVKSDGVSINSVVGRYDRMLPTLLRNATFDNLSAMILMSDWQAGNESIIGMVYDMFQVLDVIINNLESNFESVHAEVLVNGPAGANENAEMEVGNSDSGSDSEESETEGGDDENEEPVVDVILHNQKKVNHAGHSKMRSSILKDQLSILYLFTENICYVADKLIANQQDHFTCRNQEGDRNVESDLFLALYSKIVVSLHSVLRVVMKMLSCENLSNSTVNKLLIAILSTVLRIIHCNRQKLVAGNGLYESLLEMLEHIYAPAAGLPKQQTVLWKLWNIASSDASASLNTKLACLSMDLWFYSSMFKRGGSVQGYIESMQSQVHALCSEDSSNSASNSCGMLMNEYFCALADSLRNDAE